RGMSHSLAQHLRDALRSFEELLRGTDIDYYLGQSFREQLAQGGQLAERLSNKLGTRDRQDREDKTSHELLVLRLSRDLREKEKVIESLEAKLQERCESPGSSHPPSEYRRLHGGSNRGLGTCSPSIVCGSLQQVGAHQAWAGVARVAPCPKSSLAPGMPPFLPAGPPPPTATPHLGCCGPPICSLAEAQQELQVLRRQLGESE
ncbi:Myomegalin, partial [Chlamydotis macqueenii]